MYEEYNVESALLPSELSKLIEVSESTFPRFMLYRVYDYKGLQVLSRWKAYNPYWG